jgi:hypothetical protein
MRDALSVGEHVEVGLERDTAPQWRRVGQCNRCGACCKSGDPFAPREPRSARFRPCSYYHEQDGVGECTLRTMAEPPAHAVLLMNSCRSWPARPVENRPYPNCGFSFEPINDGD